MRDFGLSDLIRFSSYINKPPRSRLCWEWTGANSRGYGYIVIRKKTWRAHRVAYVVEFGSIPTGLVIDHICRNKACVNPDHLEAVTQETNVNRGLRTARPTHCKRGHEFTKENTVYCYKKYNKNVLVGRSCRTCRAIYQKQFKLKMKGKL